jgi:hypothetical protein
MPTIDFDPGEPEHTVRNRIWGRLQFPTSFDKAFELYVQFELNHIGLANVKNLELLTLPASWIKALAWGPSYAELQRGSSIRNRRGYTAGSLLWSAYTYQQAGGNVSLNSAIEVLTRAVERKEAIAVRYRPYGNKPEMHRAWKEMKNVAHLWAGLMLMDTFTPEQVSSLGISPAGYALGLSRGILSWASSDAGGHLQDREAALDLPESVAPIALQPQAAEAIPSFIAEAARSKRKW